MARLPSDAQPSRAARCDKPWRRAITTSLLSLELLINRILILAGPFRTHAADVIPDADPGAIESYEAFRGFQLEPAVKSGSPPGNDS